MATNYNLMSQLVFKFPFKTKYYEQDYYVSSNNFSAYRLIESWPNWPGKWVNIFGPKGCGKIKSPSCCGAEMSPVSK